MVYEFLKVHLVEDDKELAKIVDDYSSGRMLSGELKQLACEKLEAFMKDFVKKTDAARKKIDKLRFVKF